MKPISFLPSPSREELAAEVDRLAAGGLAALGWGDAELERAAEKTWRIAQLKARKGAVIPGHVYQRPEVLIGAADFTGDSYKLAKLCQESPAKTIVYCGVRFMAETAKILSPEKEVLLPAPDAGCSLSDAITAADVRKLKAEHPGAPVATYINTTADVKAESDVIVTSANAPKIVARLFETNRKVIFLPDEWMGRNLAKQLDKKLDKELVVWQGKCIVHEHFDAGSVAYYRKAYPGVKVLAHTECSPALVAAVDYAGGTGDMMRFVENTEAPAYMLVTECGLGDLARTKYPEKKFIPMCRLCPYMKATDLDAILRALTEPAPESRIEVPPDVIERARAALDKMFELAA